MGICQGGRFVKIGADNLYEYPLDKGTARNTLVVGGQERRRSRNPCPLPRGERPRRVGFGAKPQEIISGGE